MSIFKERKILVVEDDQMQIDALTPMLKQMGAEFKFASKVSKARDLLTTEAFDFLFSDLHVETKPGVEEPDGLEVIALAARQQPNLLIVANSSDPRKDVCDKALAAGAQHFIRKPFTKADELEIAFGLARERKTLLSAKAPRKIRGALHLSKLIEPYPDGIIINKSEYLKAQGLGRRKTMPAVLVGETGTGKEEFAKLVHRVRVREEGEIPFVAVNCATITESLAESLLFGHKKGSFTGADQTTNGYVADADGGILFLDEIHTLNMNIQRKLLRVLEDGSYNRLGETRIYRSRFQLICATTIDLDDEADEGRFLLDLRGRISGMDIFLPPLRDRKEDLPALTALHLLKKGIELSPETFELLCSRLRGFYWRTNIRQLFRLLDGWILRCEFEELPLHPDHLPLTKGLNAPENKKEKAAADVPSWQDQKDADHSAFYLRALRQDLPLEDTVGQIEAEIINAAVVRHGSVGKAAEGLGVARSTFDNKRKKHGLIKSGEDA